MFLPETWLKVVSKVVDKVIMIHSDVVSEESKAVNKKSTSKEGFSFEHRVSQKAYECIRGYPLSVFSPRSTLNHPTVPGLRHQFARAQDLFARAFIRGCACSNKAKRSFC